MNRGNDNMKYGFALQCLKCECFGANITTDNLEKTFTFTCTNKECGYTETLKAEVIEND